MLTAGLRKLMLATNRLCTLPPALATATALRKLRLEHNRLSVSIPKLKATIGRMPHLTKLIWGPELVHTSNATAGMDIIRSYLANSLPALQVEVVGEGGFDLLDLFASLHTDVDAVVGQRMMGV
jgi:hypothetical protein